MKITPTTEMQKVKNHRNWITEKEIGLLRKSAKNTRNPIRNELIILMLYRHGLRVSELCNLKIDDLNLNESKIFIRRLKKGNDSMHPIEGDELRLIRRYLRISDNNLPWLFVSERKTSIHRDTINKLLTVCSKKAEIQKIHPHMLRHGCGYYLINKDTNLRIVQDYLGHKNPQNTAIYTKLNSKKFDGLWG